MLQEQFYDEKLRELFDQLPSVNITTTNTSLQGQEIKMINYGLFQAFISKMMASAYHDGKLEAVNNMEELLASSFK